MFTWNAFFAVAGLWGASCAAACCCVLRYTSWVACRTELWTEFLIELEVEGWTQTFDQPLTWTVQLLKQLHLWWHSGCQCEQRAGDWQGMCKEWSGGSLSPVWTAMLQHVCSPERQARSSKSHRQNGQGAGQDFLNKSLSLKSACYKHERCTWSSTSKSSPLAMTLQ